MTVEDRIDRLECENRRWRLLALGMAMLMGFWLSCSTDMESRSVSAVDGSEGDPKAQVIVAKKLSIVNDSGKEVASLEAFESGARLLLGNDDRKVAIGAITEATTFTMSENGGKLKTLNFVSSEKTGNVMLLEGPNGRLFLNGGRIVVYNSDEKKLAEIGETEGRGGIFSVYNPLGKQVASMQCDKRNEGIVVVNDVKGTVIDGLTTHD